MNIWRYIIFVLFFIFSQNTSKAYSQCFNSTDAFQVGEKISYLIYYNWGFIWINAGKVNFCVKKTKYKGISAYFFDSYGQTHSYYDWFFKVRDRYYVYLDSANLRPLEFVRKTYEGGYFVNNKYIYDYTKNKIYSFTENSDKAFTKDTLDLLKCTYDVLTTVYYARNLDFSDCKINDTIPLTIILDGEIYTNLYIRYLGHEVIEHKEGGKYDCIKFSALLVEGTIFRGGEDLIVWVTNDPNRIPVYVEAKILVGSIKVYLQEAKGLKHKIRALIKN